MSDTPKVSRIETGKKVPRLLRVGIYVRVSTPRVEQLKSLSNQVSAMTRYVYLRENMILKDIYLEVSSAKTGSSRREFTRLVKDCRDQEIEFVVVKSLSRFGRDSVEVIESIRTLVNSGVTIYFMEEDMKVNIEYPELVLSVRSAIDQAENETRSRNIKMGLRFRAKSGDSGLYKKPCFGYVKGKDGNLEKDEAQAAVVVRIFELYLEGKSFSDIIDILAEEHIPSPRGSERWSKKAIETVLTNVKYTGNVQVLKTDNNRSGYVMWETHEAIIQPDDFAKVQKEIEKRARKKRKNKSSASELIENNEWPRPQKAVDEESESETVEEIN